MIIQKQLLEAKKGLLPKIAVISLTILSFNIPFISRADDFNSSPPRTRQNLTSIISCQTIGLDFFAPWSLTNNPKPDKITRVNNMFLEYSNGALDRFDYPINPPDFATGSEGQTTFGPSFRNRRNFVDIIEGTVSTFEVIKQIPLNEVGCIID
jgi:hypothetical protein